MAKPRACATISISLAGSLVMTSAVNSASISAASYYWRGARTANGESFQPNGLTAAHRSLPFGTCVRVTNIQNSRSVLVRINDRGPALWTGRAIDLSRGAATEIGMLEAGVVPVKLEPLDLKRLWPRRLSVANCVNSRETPLCIRQKYGTDRKTAQVWSPDRSNYSRCCGVPEHPVAERVIARSAAGTKVGKLTFGAHLCRRLATDHHQHD